MHEKIISIINNIREDSPDKVYISLLNLFKAIQFAFPTHIMRESPRYLFRIRTHKMDEDYFYNESDLSYRKDILDIRNFGRCNEPLQSIFYCSDNELLSFEEVSGAKKKFQYFTTSVWILKHDILISNISADITIDRNKELLSFNEHLQKIMEDPRLMGDKWELRDFLLEISKSFRMSFPKNDWIYMLSSAYSNYIFNCIGQNNEMIEGLVYPPCSSKKSIINLGLNHAFLPSIVGFGRKIELVNAYRSKIELTKNSYTTTEINYSQFINRETGAINW